jgi:hypothetical protein
VPGKGIAFGVGQRTDGPLQFDYFGLTRFSTLGLSDTGFKE